MIVRMREAEYARVLKLTESLRNHIGQFGTRGVAAKWATCFLTLGQAKDEDPRTGLSSPMRQCAFAMSLLAGTPEPGSPLEFDEAAWTACVALLEQIFGAYALMFWPHDGEETSQDWVAARQVAMPAFLHYFNASLIASTDQVKARIQSYLVPFDEHLRGSLGVSVSELLGVCETVARNTQTSWRNAQVLAVEERELRLKILKLADEGNWGRARIAQESANTGHVELIKKLFSSMDNLYRLDLETLRGEFGDAG